MITAVLQFTIDPKVIPDLRVRTMRWWLVFGAAFKGKNRHPAADAIRNVNVRRQENVILW